MGNRRMARSRNPSQAATSSRAVSRTATAATSTINNPRPRRMPEEPLSARQTAARSGKKTWTRISTPIQRPSGIDQPRIQNDCRGSDPGSRMLDGVRIIAGSLRSRTLEAPPGVATRPTSDRLRETLFNVLAPRIEGAAFLDLFAGSGAVGMEALSRGAARVEFVERAPAALKVLRGNLERLRITAGFCVHASAVGAFLRRAAQASQEREQYEVVFLDPPWDAAEEYAATQIGRAHV